MPDAQRAEIAKLESLHADHPEGRIFTHLAEAYRKAGELERAREVLAEGIERHPDYSSAHVVLARVLVDQGESAEAEAEFRRVLQLDSHNLVALRSLGDLARGAGRTDQALDLYRRLLEIEPSDEDVRAAIREIEEGPAEPVGTIPESPDEGEGGEEDSPWAGDSEDAEPVPAEEEAWTVGGAGDEEDPSAEVAWSPGEEYGDPEPPRTEDAVVEEAAVDDVGAADAEVMDDAADAVSEPAADDDLELGPDVGEPGMLTETIAQVYARQGLYDRAAEVYRQLLRVRPDDAGLRTRMEEMEALAAAPGEPAEPVDLEPEPEPEPPAGLPPLEPESPDPDVEQLPGLETTEPESVPHVAPLGGLETDEIDPETGLRTEEPSWQDWSEPSAPEVGVEPAQDYEAGDYEAGDQAGDYEAGDHEAEDHEPEAVESVWTGAGGASEAEESPYAWAEVEPEPEKDSSEPIDLYLRSLLGWAGGDQAGAAVPDAPGPGGVSPEEQDDGAEPADTAEAADTTDTADKADTADTIPTEGAAGREDAGESPDDDDLDTFRSWLESLKQ